MDSKARTEPATYVFDADRAEEERRLIAQSRLFEPITEPLLREAGLGPGMHVIDLGSGPGDMAALASRVVGPRGSVLGIERSPDSVALARVRVADLGLANVTFQEGDVTELGDVLAAHPGPVDAVVGRLILMWVPDRGAMLLRSCAQALRPGALMWFSEPDMTYDYAMPGSPLWDRLYSWVGQTLDGLGVELWMGPRLHRAFRDAGLPAPELRGRTLMFASQAAPVWLWVNIIRGLVPAMEQLGVATADDVDVETLGDRLTAELAASDGVMIVPPLTAAWARIPG